jgi:cbb3-type cytochrome oxidase subunit 3
LTDGGVYFKGDGMNFGSTTFFIYGLFLCAVFLVIIIYFYSSKRKDRIEEAKYRMLDDDDEADGTGEDKDTTEKK